MSYVGTNGNTKIVAIDSNDAIGGSRRTHKVNLELSPVLFHDVVMKVSYRIGDTLEHNCSCDSTCMLEAMKRVGKKIRENTIG